MDRGLVFGDGRLFAFQFGAERDIARGFHVVELDAVDRAGLVDRLYGARAEHAVHDAVTGGQRQSSRYFSRRLM